MSRIAILLVCLGAPITALAGGGSHVGNGGDAMALEMSADLTTAWDAVQTSTAAIFAPIRGIRIDTSLPELKIVTVDDPLESDLGGVQQESTAVNFPANQLILVNRERWSSIDDPHLKEGIALHEALSLLGFESTGSYKYSAAYVAEFGVDSGALAQTYPFVENRARYRNGSDTYSIVARERFYRGHSFFTDVRIDYTIYWNGKPAVSMQNDGGTMFTCQYGGSTDPGSLPKSFVSVASTASGPIGFLVHGQGVCAAVASEQRYHFIVPGKPDGKFDYYDVREFITADDPILRDKNGRWELWYLAQVWGNCGTAGSFYVPHLLVPASYTGISAGELPLDISQIPTFAHLTYDGFHTYYVGGLGTRNGNAMAASERYFNSIPDIVKWNTWCGLPLSVGDVDANAHAMEKLSDELHIFNGD